MNDSSVRSDVASEESIYGSRSRFRSARSWRWLFLLTLFAGGVACQQDTTPKIAAILPLTGELSVYGESIRRGVDLAYATLQQDAETPDFELEVVDSTSDPATASRLLEEQYAAGALAAIGGVSTDEALAMVPVADEASRVLVSPSASSSELTGASPKFYRVVPSDSKEGATMATFATQKMGLESVAVLSSDSPYARGIREAFGGQFEQLGGDVVEIVEFSQGSTDLAAQAEQLIATGAGGAYLAGYVDEIERMIVALRAAGYEEPLFTTSAFALPDVIERIGEPTKKVYLTQTVFDPASEEPRVRSFVEGYREAYDATPDVYAAQAYDAVLVLAEALKELGPIPADFWRSVRGVRDFSGVGGVLQFDERGDAQRFHRVYVVQKSEIVDFDVIERQRAEIRRKLEDLRRRQRAGG